MDLSSLTDPQVWGWIIVVANLIAAVCLFTAARRAKRPEEQPEIQKFAGPWLLASVLMLILAVQKQFDLFGALSTQARHAVEAMQLGIQEQWVQFTSIGVVSFFALSMLLWTIKPARELKGSYRILLAGIVAAWICVAARSSLFAELPGASHLPLEASSRVLEAIAATLLILAAAWFLQRSRARTKSTAAV